MTSPGLEAVNPRLVRAVWESTQSPSLPTTGQLPHTLEVRTMRSVATLLSFFDRISHS